MQALYGKDSFNTNVTAVERMILGSTALVLYIQVLAGLYSLYRYDYKVAPLTRGNKRTRVELYTLFLVFMLFIASMCVRFTNAGRVCSGDFIELVENESSNRQGAGASYAYYALHDGHFFASVPIILIVILPSLYFLDGLVPFDEKENGNNHADNKAIPRSNNQGARPQIDNSIKSNRR